MIVGEDFDHAIANGLLAGGSEDNGVALDDFAQAGWVVFEVLNELLHG